MMAKSTQRSWDDVVIELLCIDPHPGAGISSRGVVASPLILRAIEFALGLQGEGVSVCARVSASVADLVHFEWFGAGTMAVIAMHSTEEAEVVSYSHSRGFSSRVLRWRPDLADARGVAVAPLKVVTGAWSGSSHLFHQGD